MGIGNIIVVVVMVCVLLDVLVSVLVGLGIGLDVSGVVYKVVVIECVLVLYGVYCVDFFEIFCCFGGLEIVVLVGVYLVCV